MTKPDSTDAGGVTHEHDDSDMECPCCQCMLRSVRAGWRSGGKRLVELEAQLAEVTRDRDDHVDACAEVAAQRDEISAQLAAMTNRALKAESALATLTRERDELMGAATKALAGERATIGHGKWYAPLLNAAYAAAASKQNETEVPLCFCRKVPCECEPATPPAPLPGGQGPVEALRREIVEALRGVTLTVSGAVVFQQIADRLERAGEGREG